MDFEKLLNLFRLSHKFAGIERTVKLQNREAWETDAEHSYQLALLGWYLNDVFDLKLDRQKVLEYAIVHDLVEVYAGDTDPHKHSEEFKASKHEREAAALNKIQHEFPNFTSLTETIKKFESLADDESKFVYLLDKIVPVVNTYLSGHDYYFANGVSYTRWQEWLNEKRQKASFVNGKFNLLLDKVSDFFGNVKPGFFK